jgi:hypothetical protein
LGSLHQKEEITMHKLTGLCLALVAAALVAACNDGTGGSSSIVDSSGARGSLMQNPPLRIASLTAADFTTQLGATPAGAQLLQVTGPAACGVDFHYIQYGTVGGAGEATTASGALMVPTGSGLTDKGVPCGGPQPILLYAHGTSTDRNMNIADITNPNNSEGALIAATFAAHGYIVIAPNYAGYDSSPLTYHPFLNADQQSKDMFDALTAGRKALGSIFAAGTTDNGKLFITGYSQGGHVAMATHKAMQAAALTVTASGPMSGPYAVSSFGDAVFFGNVNLGSTVFAPMLATSYQRAYGNIYTSPTNPTNIFAAPYAATVDAILPNVTPLATLFATGKLPQTTLLSSTILTNTGNATLDAIAMSITPPTTPAAQAPLFALGFGTTNLITNTYRQAYLIDAINHPDGVVPTPSTGLPPAAPTDTLRQAFKTNDMRSWVPTSPVLLCGGHQDPTVFYSVNTQTMQAFWTPQIAVPQLLTVVDVDPAPGAPVGPVQTGFEAGVTAVATAAVLAGATDGGLAAVTQAYHGTLVPPFCAATVRGFFANF